MSMAAATVGPVTSESSTAAGSAGAGPTTAPAPALDSLAGSTSRFRCAACGNLTRFDVVMNRRTRSFHHFSVGGDLTIEEVEVLDESVEEVLCRWCGNGSAVEVLETGLPDGA